MFMTESRRKFSRQKDCRKEISSYRAYPPLTSTSLPHDDLNEGENAESSVPAPFIVGFYRPDNSLMAYKGQRSKQVKLSQSVQNRTLRSDSYLKESTPSDRMIHNNVTSYSTRHMHAIKPAVPSVSSKFRTCSRTTEDINKDIHSSSQQRSPGPVLSQALKLEKFRSPDFNSTHSVTRTHAWVEQQTISEKANEHGLNAVQSNSNIKLEYRPNKVNAAAQQSEVCRKVPHQVTIHENLNGDHPISNRQLRVEKPTFCSHFSPKDDLERESLRNACTKWFARDDVNSVHRHIPNKSSNFVDLSLNIKSNEEPEKVVQKETIGRTHQETSTKRRHLGEDEDKSSSESGRGTMQSGMIGPKHHLDISLDSDHSVVTWKKKEAIACNQATQREMGTHDIPQSSKPKAMSSLQESSSSERKDRQRSHQPIRNRCQNGLKSSINRNYHQNKIFLNETESTTTSLDLESLTIEDDDDISGLNYREENEMSLIRQQLEGLEAMYSEILRLLGVKSRCLKMNSRNSRSDYHRGGRPKKIHGSLSSLTGKSCSTHREKSHCHNERRRCKESRNGGSSRCFQRLESHVVNLARNVARLSSEIRSQQCLVRELDELRNDVTWVREQLKLVQSSTSKSIKDWDTFRAEVLQILNPGRIRKLTKFFGAEPPLLRQFLKRLGYEKYAPNFETEKIGIMELPYLNEEKLQKLGIPMGPRIRILQEAHFTFRQNDLKIYIV